MSYTKQCSGENCTKVVMYNVALCQDCMFKQLQATNAAMQEKINGLEFNHTYLAKSNYKLYDIKKQLEAELDKLKKALNKIIVESGDVDSANWPIQQQVCQPIAQQALNNNL